MNKKEVFGLELSCDPAALTPAAARAAIRRGEITRPHHRVFGAGFAQGNLVVLPKALAWDFLLFCQRNPKACPLLEVADAGARTFAQFAPGSDIRRRHPPLPRLRARQADGRTHRRDGVF